MTEPLTNLEFHPLTPDRWADFEMLFGPKGAMAGCWCMWWRSPRSEFSRRQGEGNRQAMKTIVESGAPTGLLAYVDGVPAGWISLAPREHYTALERSKLLARIDDRPVWSIVCFFVHRKYRRRGLMAPLIAAACDYACSQGAKIIEAYPIITGEKAGPTSTYMGIFPTFLGAGFIEVARPSPNHPIMRKNLVSLESPRAAR